MLEILTKNWFAKLLSIIFALILWFFVMGEQKLEVGYAVPLEVKNAPAGLMVASDVPSLVDVRISGPRTLLMNLSPKDISIAVDLAGLKPGLTSFKRLEENLNIPSALKVTRLSPSFVDIKLDRVKVRKAPVKVVLSGEPAEGFRVLSVHAAPEEVEVEGAESELKNIHEVVTEAVDLSGVRESFTLMIPLDYRGKYTYLAEDKTTEVRVEIEPAAPRTPLLQGGAEEAPGPETIQENP